MFRSLRHISIVLPRRALACVLPILVAAGQPLRAQGAAPSAPRSVAPGSAGWVRESWSIADGLPVNSVNALLQDRTGYIWAATFDGLVRFDGVRFTVFSTANSPGLPSDRIISMQEARDGAIWILTEQRDLVRLAEGRFTHFDRGRGIDGVVWAIGEDAAGTLWVGTDHGVGMIRGGRYVPVAAGELHGPVTSLAAARDGGLWVGTPGHGVFLVRGQEVRRVSGGLALDSALVGAMLEDDAGRFWVSAGAVVYQLSAGPERRLEASWPAPAIQRFLVVPKREGVLGYSGAGLVRFERGLAAPVNVAPLASRFTNSAPMLLRGTDSVWAAMGRDVFLNGRSVYRLEPEVAGAAVRITDMQIDREGGIWLATEGMGLQRLRRSLFTVYGAPEGLAARNAYVVTRDSSDAVWVGSTIDGLSRIAPDRRSVRNWDRLVGRGALVGSLLADGANRLLVGTDQKLLACALPDLRCAEEPLPPLEFVPGWPGILALHRTADGRLVAGTGVQVFEQHAGRWQVLPGWNVRRPARAFADGADGALWVGTNGGGVVRCAGGRCRAITTRDGLPSDIIRSLLVDQEGWLWIGTEGRGLARLDARRWPAADERWAPPIVPITVADGLYDPVVHQILDDGQGRFWMNSNRGISWVTRADLLAFADGRARRVRSVAYTERDGLRNREGNGGFQPAGMRGRDGTLWFPTQDGVVRVDPSQVPREQAPPPVVVEHVSTRARLLAAGGVPLALEASERDLEFAYTALTFREPRNVRFRYRLDPYDAGWVDAGSRRTAFYTRVPPGRYTFRVAASQGGDAWSERAATLELAVAPSFRETAAAQVLLALALIAAGALAVRWRLRRLRAREAELTMLVQERTAALQRNERQLATQNAKLEQLNQLRSRLFANLSHEFRTPLTLILGPLRSLLDGRHGPLAAGVREQAELMLRNGQRLLRLINQILDLARLQAGAVAITRQPLELLGFVRSIAQAFTPLAERQGIAVVFRSPLRTLTVPADAEQLEKVLLNLLSNAVKFTGAGGIVDVSVAQEGAQAVITVRDTGVGIGADDLPHIFERFYQVDSDTTRRFDGTGIGLALAKELVEVHGGRIGVTSTLGAGSTFTVRLPLAGAGTAAGAGAAAPAPSGALDEFVALPSPDPASTHPQEESADDRITVLLVDDNADVRAYVRSVLAPAFHVLEAADGRAGLALAREALPDLIVADVMMPELDGLGLGRALKADPMTDAIPVILLTARAAAEDQIAGLGAGADAYLVKPFDPGVLTAAVDNLLAQRRRLRERFRQGEAPTPVAEPAAPSPLDLRLRPLVQARLLDRAFNPESLAAAAELSYGQLYRALRDELGTTPSKYIRTVRAECAAELLRQGAGSVTEVAYAVGFESLSYFRRAFRERFDRTPSDFLAPEAARAPSDASP